jgi:FlaA1/EpsC-like NDP-sugar epimerase
MLLKSAFVGAASRGTLEQISSMTLLVTGAAGFIGANFALDWLASSQEPIINLDKLTYAGNLETLSSLQGDARHVFVQGDIGDAELVNRLLAEHQPRAVLNFAAESHVDRSIHGPGDFIETNIVGTFRLLESVRGYWSALPENRQIGFPVFARVHRRGLWLTGQRCPRLCGDAPVRAQQPLQREQGCV